MEVALQLHLRKMTSSHLYSYMVRRLFSRRIALTGLEAQTGFGGEPEKLFTHSRMLIPMARVPDCTTDIITTIEKLGELHAAKLSNRTKCRRLHFDGQAPFGATTLYTSGGFAVDGVGGLGLAQHIRTVVCL